MRRFLNRMGDGHARLALFTNPLTLGPFIYLNSLLGMSGYADGAAVNLWPDQSGNGHDGTQSVAAQKPQMNRVNPSFLSPNGSATVHFRGTDANPDNVGGTLTPNPSVANGYDLLFYGRFWFPVNAAGGSVLFQDDTGGRPQFGFCSSSPNNKWFKRDDLGTTEGSAFTATCFCIIRAKFVASNATQGTFTMSHNDGAGFVTVLSCPYQFNPAAAGGWILGSNQVFNVPAKMDACAFAWYTKVLTNNQVTGIYNYWRNQFE